ncbi:MAG TPA: hypothetical protein EYP19_03020, partial [Desulfobacterales bacterium]|nr:hypothetical protein [Desulfobacterales bacterium]
MAGGESTEVRSGLGRQQGMHIFGGGMMTGYLWDTIKQFVQTGKETRKVELKRELVFSDRTKQAEFAKDICALANTSGGTGYLIIGVLDAKERTSDDPASYIVGVSYNEDEFQRQIQQALSNFCNPVPEIRLETTRDPQTLKSIGVIVVPRSIRRPHEIIRESGKVQKGIYVRRGAETFQATRAEILEMTTGGRDVCLLVNLGRPITKDQQEQISRLFDVQILEIVEPDEIPPKFDDNQPYEFQIAQLVNSLGLTPEEWQTLRIIVNLPGFAP